MAYINTQKLLKQTLATCYLKNVDTKQQANWTTSPPNSYSVPQWIGARWMVEQEASEGFPTPHFQNITFNNLKSSKDYGALSPLRKAVVVSGWSEGDATALEANGASFDVYWKENPRVKTFY
jgi:hypothetical protein